MSEDFDVPIAEWYVCYTNYDEDSNEELTMTIFEYPDCPLDYEKVLQEVRYSFNVQEFHPKSHIGISSVKRVSV